MPLHAYDGASPFDLAAAKAHGGIVCTVYLVGHPGGMAPADRARVNAIRRAGMGVLPNWERAADFFRTATLADCRHAGAEALAACRALGIPDDGSVGVPFSFDYQVHPTQFARATDQLKACGDGLGGHYRPLGYAQIDLIEHWAAHGIAGPHWLMGSTWRSTSRFYAAEVGSPNVALVQSHDAAGRWLSSPVPGTDINTVTQPERLLAWWPDGSPYDTQEITVDAELKTRLDRIDAALADLPRGINSWDGIDAPGDDPKNPTWAPSTYLRLTYNQLAGLRASLDPAKLAAAIAGAMPPGASVDLAELTTAAAAGVRAVFADAATP